MKRGSGVLLHISSLPGKYGIGSLGKAAYDFVDKLTEAGQSYWQILPCSPTGYGDSPYQGTSAFAGNPYFIDLDLLIQDGLLAKEDLKAFRLSADSRKADYAAQYRCRFSLLEIAYRNGQDKYAREFSDFKYRHGDWIFDYSLFVVLKRHFKGRAWTQWDGGAKNRESAALMRLAQQYSEEIESVQFAQFLYEKQWMKLKDYANRNGVRIIGDIPIYVSSDSVETWAHPELFLQDGSVSGCPPDSFSKEGQLWGNPIYDWEAMKERGYDWWISRVARCMQLYDLIRIDHFRGLESYFSIPKNGEPKDGHWEKGPGREFVDALRARLGELPILAEDLGFLTPEVFEFLAYCGFAGTKVLQFAFDSEDSIYLPHYYPRNCVCYTGTHDNNTTKGWYKELNREGRKRLKDYIGHVTIETVSAKLIRAAMMSVADLCIIPMQDILNLSEAARMNVPSRAMGNWQWRMAKEDFDEAHITALREITQIYGRI